MRIHTIPEAHERELDAAALSTVPDAATAVRLRDDAVRRMREARAALAAEIAGVSGIEVSRDDEWSVMHVLAHIGKDNGGHFTHVYDVLERSLTELEPFEDRDELLRRARVAALEQIDRTIAFAAGLGGEQLLKHARRGGRDHYVLGFVELAADHLEEHLAQLREMKGSLASAKERRAAANA
jgi:hypothetical protein